MKVENIICRFSFCGVEYLICSIEGKLWWYRIKPLYDTLNPTFEVYEPMQRLI